MAHQIAAPARLRTSGLARRSPSAQLSCVAFLKKKTLRSGEVLQIRRFAELSGGELSQLPLKTDTIQVHKVDLTSEKLLVEVDTLGGNVLFIGRSQSLCLCAKEYPQLKPNHAYFTDDEYLSVTCFKFKNLKRDIGEFDLENNRNMEIVSPQLWSNSPTPVWLVPNPRRMSLASHN